MTKSQEVQCRHFRWRISPRQPSGTWYADGRGNAPYRIKIHSLDTKDKNAALEALKQLDRKMAMDHGRIIKVDAGDDHQLLLISAGVDKYLEWVGRPAVTGGASAGTVKRYRSVFDKFKALAEKKGIKYWQHVNDQVLNDYCSWLEKKEYAYATEYAELTTLKQAMKAMAKNLGVKGLPEINIELKKPRGSSTYCYTTEEVDAMVRFCMARPDLIWLGRVIKALAHTGLRISELAELRWTDIKDDELHLPDLSRHGTKEQRDRARTTKGRRDRRFPVHGSLAKVLGEMERHKDDWIFHGPRGGRLKPDTVRNILIREVIEPLKGRFPKVSDEPSFEDGRVHSLRHYFVSCCAASREVSEMVVKDWVGHQESAMLKRYFHLSREAAAHCMNKVTFMTEDTETK